MKPLAGALLLSTTIAAAAGQAVGLPVELRDLVESPEPAGCSDYRFLFWDFYRAELWSDARELPGEAFALSLVYRTDFTRDELVENSIKEMSRIAERPVAAFTQVASEMRQAFRDVARGDRITAWRAGPDRLQLFVNGRETGALTDEIDLFLAIWLGEDTRHPDGRQALIEGRCDG